MTDNPEKSKYFDHWRYDGNALQKRLKIGPKSAMYLSEQSWALREHAKFIAENPEQEIEFEGPSVGVSQAGEYKTTGTERWWIDFAERQGTEDYAHLVRKSPWAFRCIEIRSRALAAIPFDIYKGDKPIEDTEYERRLREVNPEVNWEDLISATSADLLVYPFALWQKIRTGKKVTALNRLNPSTIKVDADDSGIKRFINKKNTGVTYPRRDIVYFKTYDPKSDITGIPAISTIADAIEVETEANETLKVFFKNRAMPDYIIALDTNNKAELKRISDQWKREFEGAGKQHKTGWVGGGAKVNQMGYAPRDLGLEGVRAEARRQICAGMGVPPALVAAWEAANYATIREQRQSLYTEVLFPEARYIAGVINAELSPEFGDLQFRWDFTKVDAMQESEDAKVKRMVWLVDGLILKPEVAAVELGYSPEDVPEPKPAPTFGGGDPTDNNNNVGRVSTPPPVSPGKTDDSKGESALRKWRRKSLNRLRDGKSALCDFESAYLSDTLSEAIKGQLEGAETADGVHEVFESAIVWREYP